MVSKNKPSLVLALPMVPHAISLPFTEKLEVSIPFTFLYIFDAFVNPYNLGICPAVGEMSALELYCSVKFFHWPYSSKLWVPK